MQFELTRSDVELLIEALDSHCYWQLSDHEYRRDGFVIDPGADDRDAQAAIRQALELASHLEDALRAKGATQ